jgi:hypothetical protein
MSNQLAIQTLPVSELEAMANHIVKSGLFGMRKVEEAVALMLVAQSEQQHPASIANTYHIIQGRPALKADAMLARFQQAGGRVEWHEYTDECVSATFTHAAGGSLKVDWDMARANAAGLGNKDNWKKYKRQMLRARVISDGVRGVYPAVLGGFYTPEEVQDFAPAAPAPAAKPAKRLPQPETVEVEVVESAPAPESEPELEEWQEKLAANEVAVNAFLVLKGQIQPDQTWRDLNNEAYLSRIQAQTDKFIAAALAAQEGK